MMDPNVLIENSFPDRRGDDMSEAQLQDRIKALELQLKIFKQAETIGEIGNWQINLKTFETWYSENLFRLYGLEANSIKPHPDTFTPFIHEEDREIVVSTFEKSYREHVPLHLEYRIVTAGGNERHVNVISSVTKNPNGESLLTGITQDITDRKSLEIKLSQSAERHNLQNESFKHAEQIGEFGTLKVNLHTRLCEYSDNFLRLFGIKPAIPTMGFDQLFDFIHTDDQLIFRQIRNKIFEEHQPPEGEFRVVRPDGKIRQVRLRCKLLKSAEGDQLVIGVIRDTTRSDQLERQLKEANEKLLLQNEAFGLAEKISNIGSWTWNTNTNNIHLSDNLYLLYGLKPQSLPGGSEDFLKYVHPTDRQRVIEYREKQLQAPEEVDFNYRIVRADGEVRHLRSRSQTFISPEGHTILIGTTQDHTEDFLLHQQLNERISFAEMMSENIIDMVVITNTSNNIIGWNSKAEKSYGLKKEQVIGKNLFEVFPKIKRPEVIERYNRVLSGEVVHLPEMELAYVKGYHEVSMVPIKDEKGNVSAVLSLIHNISEQINLRSELKDRLEFIEKLIQLSVHRIAVLDRDLNFMYWNQKSEEFYQLTKEKVIGRNIAEVFPSYRRQTYYTHLKKALLGETVHVPVSAEADLSIFTDEYMIPIKRNPKEVIAVLWIVHDLTDLVNTQKELKMQNQLLEAVLNAPNVGINVFKAIRNESGEVKDFQFILVSGNGFELLGINNAEERTLFEVFPKRRKYLDAYSKLLDTGAMEVFEERLMTEKGERWLLQTNAKFGDGFLSVWQDITEKKKAEGEVKKHSTLLQQASEIANLGSWELDVVSNVFTWSDQLYRIYDYVPQSFTPTLDFYLTTTETADRESVNTAFELAKTGQPFSLTHSLHSLDGRTLVVMLKGQPSMNQDGAISSIVGTVQDITEQKEIERQLLKKNETIRLQYQVDRQADSLRKAGTWQMNLETNEVVWGENMFRVLDKEPFSFKPSFGVLMRLVHQADRNHIGKSWEEFIKTSDQRVRSFDFRIKLKDGVHFMRSACRKMANSTGRFVVGTTFDISEDKQLQEQLAERMNFVEALIESSVDRIMAFDRELNILAWNKKCELTYGYKKEEVIGKSYLEIFPKIRENHIVMAALQSALEGTPVYVPAQKIHYTDGYVEGHYIPLKKGEKETYGLLNIIHDVTDRIKSESELRELNESLLQKNKELEEMNDCTSRSE